MPSLSLFLLTIYPSILQLSKERELRGQLEALASELAPLETQRQQLAQRSERRTNGGN